MNTPDPVDPIKDEILAKLIHPQTYPERHALLSEAKAQLDAHYASIGHWFVDKKNLTRYYCNCGYQSNTKLSMQSHIDWCLATKQNGVLPTTGHQNWCDAPKKALGGDDE